MWKVWNQKNNLRAEGDYTDWEASMDHCRTSSFWTVLIDLPTLFIAQYRDEFLWIAWKKEK